MSNPRAGRWCGSQAFASLKTVTAPLAIIHDGQFPAVTLSFNLRPGHARWATRCKAIQEVQKSRSGCPSTVATEFTGSAAEFRSSLQSEPFLILAAIVVIYIVLGVLYESYIHPITILSSLPSAGVGALLALIVCRTDLSLIALIGIILLIGIVKKNAIMMIDFALEAEREQGMAPEESIHQACLLRFRPIMMTTMAALLGALPLALENGTGSELRRPLGISIVGGLLLSQFITLYTTPVIYLYLDRLSAWVRTRRAPALRAPMPCQRRNRPHRMSISEPFIRRPVGDGAPGDRPLHPGDGGIPRHAGRGYSAGGVSDDLGHGQHPRRRPADRGLFPGRAARAAAKSDLRRDRDYLQQCAGWLLDHGAV